MAPFVRRECGLDIELDDVPVQSLVPEPLRGVKSADEYMKRLPEFDAEMDRLQKEAAEAGECLRYVGESSREGCVYGGDGVTGGVGVGVPALGGRACRRVSGKSGRSSLELLLLRIC